MDYVNKKNIELCKSFLERNPEFPEKFEMKEFMKLLDNFEGLTQKQVWEILIITWTELKQQFDIEKIMERFGKNLLAIGITKMNIEKELPELMKKLKDE